jgi:Zn-dependent M32 family carboxypeptidase
VTYARRSIVAAMLLAFAGVARAQSAETQAGQAPARPQRGGQRASAMAPSDRQALQRRVRQAFTAVVRRQLNLDAAQMQTLQRVDQKYEQQRRAVLRDERNARMNLKLAMEDSTGHPDQDKISQYLDELVKGQRRRADLLDAEQKELSSFLSPLQRAKYFSLKERVAKKMLELQSDSAGGRPGRAAAPLPQP